MICPVCKVIRKILLEIDKTDEQTNTVNTKLAIEHDKLLTKIYQICEEFLYEKK